LWLIKVWFSASTFVVKIATFAKPENVMHNKKQKHENDENSNFDYFNIYSWKSKWADNN
jgi:hypothetical protein